MRLTFRPANLPTDYPRIAELLNTTSNKPVTADDLAREDQGMPEGSIIEYVMAIDEAGRPVGYGKAHRFPNTIPGKIYTYLVVDPAERGKGIGLPLLQEVERIAIAHGANYLTGDVRDNDPASLAFMEKRGYKVKRHWFYSSLDLASWDGSPFAGVVDQVNASGIRFVTLEDDPASDAEQRLYKMMSRTMVEIPGYEATAFMSFETWENFLIKPAGKANVIVAVDGESFVGVTTLEKMEGGDYYTPHTSVLREYRGRQIALGLKLVAIAKARGYGAQRMTTGNDSLNVPMLAVNKRLGYVPSAGGYDVVKYLQ